MNTWNRREVLLAGAMLGTAPTALLASEMSTMRTATIPATGEQLPVIGLGTYSVFDVASTTEEISRRREIVDLLSSNGGSVIDTSPMYKRSEQVIGDVIASGADRKQLFIATKGWTGCPAT